jgi:hypothetical protein
MLQLGSLAKAAGWRNPLADSVMGAAYRSGETRGVDLQLLKQ